MSKIIGIRREDKNIWERRVPFIPTDIKELNERFGIETIIQPSKIRVFTDQEYKLNGAIISENLSNAHIVLAVKEIPKELFQAEKTYIFFSHTIKGQQYNMGMLQRMIDLKCNLIDYERIVNEKNQRLIFFGKYAGLAGMIETLHAYGQKLKLRGYQTSLENIRQAYRYSSVSNAISELTDIAREITLKGFPDELSPIVVGFAGYGNVSRGAQEIFDIFPHKELTPEELISDYDSLSSEKIHFYKVVFREEHMVNPKSGNFDLQEYYDHPERYYSNFESYLPFLNVLVNCIFWTDDYPHFVSKKYLRKNPDSKLCVIGDISCDINGSIEITTKVTLPDQPTFTYFPDQNVYRDGTYANGVTVMAVDNLPGEFSREASIEFSTALKQMIKEIADIDFKVDFEELSLSYPVKKALILHRGELTAEYHYMNQFLTQDQE